LYAIRASENASPDDYNVFYGGSRFYDLSDHPVATGEKNGVPLSAEMCRNAGYSEGCVSTAAGAYQITLPTWRDFRSYGGETLPDFSPESQDIAAARILADLGALDYIDAGDIESAIQIAGRRWASLPGSTARQRQKSMQWVLSQYERGLNLLG
jgi:lysozyme